MDRLRLAWRVLIDGVFADNVVAALDEFEAKASKSEVPAERVHASGLMLLAALQREGRLIDFLQQDTAGFSDEDVGAAARVVHSGCRTVVRQFFHFEPAVKEREGSVMTVPSGFDAQKLRLTGNVTGHPPFRGTLTHHGWIATEIRMPDLSDAIDPRVIAPAEVDLT